MQRISTLFRGVEPALFIGVAELRPSLPKAREAGATKLCRASRRPN